MSGHVAEESLQVQRRSACANQPHREELLKQSAPLRDRIAQLENHRQELSEFMAAHPEALAKTAQLAHALRLGLDFIWKSKLRDYLGDDTTQGKLMRGEIAPPWPDLEKLLAPFD